MPDRGKVIKGLKLCVQSGDFCGECPYDGTELCIDHLHDETLVLLKEQEETELCDRAVGEERNQTGKLNADMSL